MRATVTGSQRRVRFATTTRADADPRVAALVEAARRRRVVRLAARSTAPVTVHPVGLVRQADGWAVIDDLDPNTPVPERHWGTVNVSALTF